MANLVVVTGATGQQGAGVIDALLKDPQKWKIRAITRKTTSEKAQALASKGVEVVAADLNSEDSLKAAFKGAFAIFAVTPYWESVIPLGLHGAGEEEVEQLKAVARAAAATPTLKHMLLSSLPTPIRVSNGKHSVPHFDYKGKAFDWWLENTPELVAKTTRFWPGWYGNNAIYFPISRFIKTPSGIYLLVNPAKRESIAPVIGDVGSGMGTAVQAVLGRGESVHGKIVHVISEYLAWHEIARTFTKATGQECAYAEMSDEEAIHLYGDLFGKEMAAQFRWLEEHPDWSVMAPSDEIVTLKDLGIEDKVIKLEAYWASVKDQIL